MIKFTYIFIFIFSVNTFAGEKDVYSYEWLDQDKVVYVLQNKIFEKRMTWYLNAGWGFATDSDFQDTTTLQGKTGFFFTEDWGIELIYSTISNQNSMTMKNISTSIESVPFVRRLTSYYGGAIIFSPFYGKINTFNWIYYYDWNFGLGVAQMDGENNLTSFTNQDKNNLYENDDRIGYIFKTELRFYLTKHINLNIDLLKIFYNAPSVNNPKKELFLDYTDLIFALGFSI